MIFKRKQHKLPKFPASVAPTFKNLCETLPAEQVLAYKEEVAKELERLRDEAQSNELIDMHLAEELAKRCYLVLDHYQELTPAGQALAVGAIRYFALSKDSFSEQHFASGFNDDVKIMNHVLEELGFEDQFVELPQY